MSTLQMERDPWEGLPDDLKLEMMLEMLVDDELPEGQRAKLLRSLDSMPQQWRTLALRFLERQAEHTSVKQFISSSGIAPAPAAGAPDTRSFRFPTGNYRIAASLVVLAGLSAAVIIALNQTKPTDKNVASIELIQMPGKSLGAADGASVPVSLTKTQEMPSTLLQSTLNNNASRQFYIVPQGPDKAAIVPVTTAKADIIY